MAKNGPAVAAKGSDVAYSITVANLGPDPATVVVLTDVIPAGMTFVSALQNNGPAFTCTDPGVGNNGTVQCSIATLAVSAQANFTFTFNIPTATPPGTTFTNQATIKGAEPDPNSENDESTAATTTPIPQSDAGISKVGPSTAGPNTDVVYTISVTNAGPDDAATESWSDLLPGNMTFVSLMQTGGPAMSCTTPGGGSGGTVSCSASPFPALGNATFTLTTHIPSPASSSYTNSATVTAPNDLNPDNNSSSTTLTVSAVDISVTKSGPASAPAGTDISYTLTIANAGPDVAIDVTLSDVLPPGTTFVSVLQDTGPSAFCSAPPPGTNGTVTCSMATLASLASAQFTLTINTGSASVIMNTASGSTGSFDTNHGNDSASANTTVTQSADVAVTKSGPANVVAGSDITYTVVVTNNGPSNAATVSLTDTLPPNTTFVSENQTAGPAFSCSTPAGGGTGTITCNIATLTVGASGTFSFVFHVAPAASGSIANTANVSAATSDPTPGNNSSTMTSTVGAGPTDVSIVKTANRNAFETGTTAVYTVVVTNNGPGIAAGTTVTDILPAGATATSATPTQGSCSGTTTVTCNVGTLSPGGSATITLNVTLTTLGPTSNTAAVTIANTDTNPANNASTAVVTVVPLGAIPTLSPLALLLLALALAVCGGGLLARRA